ncbi:MAG TPA: alpha-hydroxy acid oxidase [Burkholderiales bacterium]|nr:alpha-hydroxy acid oxidase [Burkholderiales bacterium]
MRQDEFRRRAYSVAALREMARRRLPRAVFDFVDGGAEDEVVVGRNESVFDALTLLPQPMRGTTRRDQSVELFGRRLAAPVLIGPTGMTGLLWPRGEIEAARAAAAAGTVYTMSHGAAVKMEELAAEAPGNLWMQVFPYKDRGLTQSFVERARAAGFQALVLTVDNQLLGQRERDVRNGFTIPPRFELGGLVDMALHLRWLLRMARAPRLAMANYEREGDTGVFSISARVLGWMDAAASWKEVEWLRGIWDRPLVVKGILHPDDARRAQAIGVDAVVVSNHGGRQLDVVPASLEALPAVADAVGGRMPVLIDGGVRRGGDVAKALALGATACLIGRPHLWGAAVAGEQGVARVLEIYRTELDRVMGLCGWDSLRDIDRSVIFDPSSGSGSVLGAVGRKLAAMMK